MHSLYSSLLMIILTLLIFVGFPKCKLKFNKLLLLFILTDKLNPNEEVFFLYFHEMLLQLTYICEQSCFYGRINF